MHPNDKIQTIIQKTAELLLSAENPEEVTTRRIADNAGINPAMVNYYFGSKEDLLKTALLMVTGIQGHTYATEGSRKEMFDLLVCACETSMLFSGYGLSMTKVSLAKDVLETSLKLIGIIERHDGKSPRDPKISAYKMVSLLLTASADPQGFMECSGIDIRSKNQLRMLISSQLDILLGDAL
ncbi:MAG: TetR/AcrR family transcriptional regulator [Candidatus Methanoplasma sp.]|nr:TetR/AcrR family transcriptional regulator [Candidatus Methanoplasma sp.]